MSEKVKVDENTQENLVNLMEQQQEIQNKINLIVNTYKNSKGLNDDYEVQQLADGFYFVEPEDENED